MLARARQEIERHAPPPATVLDVGGWADPLERADVVIDLMPYDSRGLYAREGWIDASGRAEERFTASTWVERDVCAREPWPFADRQFDLVVCAHTLEDVRDPLWVCAEMRRVGRAGYIEVPSRLEEQSYGVEGDWVGWAHHRWLIEVRDGSIEFVFKTHDIHSRPDCHFPRGFWEGLSEEERVQSLWWEGDFGFSEQVFMEERPHERYLPDFVRREMEARSAPTTRRRRGLSRRPRRAGS